MPRFSNLCVVAAAVGAIAVSAAFAQATTITASATAPTAGVGQTVIASNLPSSGATAAYNGSGLNYYTNGGSPGYSAIPAETFTTGATPGLLDSITVQTNGTSATPPTVGNLDIAVADTANHTFSGLVQKSGSLPTGISTPNDYITFTFGTPVALAANTTYLYGAYTNYGSSTYAGLNLTTTGGTASQQLATFSVIPYNVSTANTTGSYTTYTGGGASGVAASGTSGTDTAVFEAIGTGATAIPEPATASQALAGVAIIGLAMRRRRHVA